MGIIYKVSNINNDKIYIGQTIRTLKERWEQHITDSHNKKDITNHFHNAIRKYGAQSFNPIILEECDNDLLNEREKYWINYYDSYNNGYNSTLGGNGREGYIVDIDLVINLIKSGQKIDDISNQIGVPHAVITRRLKAAGVDLTKQIQKNRRIQPVYQWDNVGNLINIFSSGTEVEEKLKYNRKSISFAIKNKTRAFDFYWTHGEKPEYKYRVAQYDLNNNFIKYWKDAATAARFYKTDSSALNKCCRGQQKTCVGFIWKRE